MGFFDGLARGMGVSKSNREILDIVYDEDDDIQNNNYRRTGLENTPSNYGWYKCIKCGKNFRKGDMDIDHILPKSEGGTNSRYNLQCICKHCNRSKQADTSDTAEDLRRRKREINQQYREDAKFLRNMEKNGKK